MNGQTPKLNDLWTAVLDRARANAAAKTGGTVMAPSLPPPQAFIGPPAGPIPVTPEALDAAAIAATPPVVQSTPAAPVLSDRERGKSMVNGLADAWIAKALQPKPQTAPTKSAEEIADEKYRQRQAESYMSPEQLAAKRASAAPPAAMDPAGVKFVTPGVGGGAPDERGAPPVAVAWGGGGGGARVIPAHEVATVSAARQAQENAAIDAQGKAVEGQKTAAQGSADAAADTESAKAEGLRLQADTTKEAAASAKARTAQAKADAAAFRAHIDEFSARIASDKIDPNGMWNNADTGQKVAWTLAKAFGAVGQAFLHTPTNQVADHIDQMAAQDVAAQRQNHETGRERVQDMNSMYAQALKATGDAEEAERVAQGYALTAAKQQAEALASDATSKQQKARGAELSAALDERIGLLQEKKVEKGIAMNPLVQAQTVGGVGNEKEIGNLVRQRIENQAKEGHIVTPAQAYWWVMATNGRPVSGAGDYVGGAKDGGGEGMTREQRGKIAAERSETQTATDEFNRQIAALKSHPAITGTGLTDAAFAHLPSRIAPDSNASNQELKAINTQLLQAVGKVAKDADGKPNKAMIEKIENNFEIHQGDPLPMKLKKLEGVASVYNALARQQGAVAPMPNAQPKVDPTFKKE